jgi:hypothetical protein
MSECGYLKEEFMEETQEKFKENSGISEEEFFSL